MGSSPGRNLICRDVRGCKIGIARPSKGLSGFALHLNGTINIQRISRWSHKNRFHKQWKESIIYLDSLRLEFGVLTIWQNTLTAQYYSAENLIFPLVCILVTLYGMFHKWCRIAAAIPFSYLPIPDMSRTWCHTSHYIFAYFIFRNIGFLKCKALFMPQNKTCSILLSSSCLGPWAKAGNYLIFSKNSFDFYIFIGVFLFSSPRTKLSFISRTLSFSPSILVTRTRESHSPKAYYRNSTLSSGYHTVWNYIGSFHTC